MELLGNHFPQWGRELWEPIQTAVTKTQLPVHTFVAEHEPRYVEQAFQLVLQHPADLVHLSKPRLPAGLVDIDDEELCNACEREPITLNGLKRRWTRLAVDLAATGALWRHGIRGGSSRSRQVMKPAEWAGAGAAKGSQKQQDPHQLQPLRSLSLSPCALPAKPPSLLGR